MESVSLARKLRRIISYAKKELRRPAVKNDIPLEGWKAIDGRVLEYWFAADTDADDQLMGAIKEQERTYHTPTHSEICQTLFGVEDIYALHSRSKLAKPMHYPAHFGERTLKLLDEKISRNNPIGIEVGSFIGSSAVLLGDFLQAKGGSLICIDTWLGDINMWLLDRFSQTMGKDDGNPKIFQHFLDNIKDHSLERTIVPLRLPSLVAARMLKVLKWNVDFVYLDSAHEAGETFMELSLYWNLLRKGGILFGDDYNNFPAVKHDLDLFCRVIGQSPTFTGEGDTWILYK